MATAIARINWLGASGGRSAARLRNECELNESQPAIERSTVNSPAPDHRKTLRATKDVLLLHAGR